VVFIRDITERVESEDWKRQFQELFIEIATDFMRRPSEDFDEVVNATLQKLGEFVDADRSSVFLFREDSRIRDNTHEWCAAGIEPQQDRLQALEAADATWWMSQLDKLEPLIVPRTADLPAEAAYEKEMLQSQGIQSVLLVPMLDQQVLAGYVAFDAVRAQRSWDREIIALLQMVAPIVLSAIKRKRAESKLRASEARFQRLFRYAPQAMVMVDETGSVAQSNRNAQKLFGYDESGFVGQSIEALLPTEVRQDEENELLRDRTLASTGSLAKGRVMQAVRRDGRKFDAEVGVVRLAVSGETQMLAGVMDISQRLAAQKALARSLREKETLLREIHHRVKNNLQIISSMLTLQSDEFATEDTRKLLQESVHRVRSMALIHQQLYGVESLSHIDLGDYTRSLADTLRMAFAPGARLQVRSAKVEVTVEVAVPLGLILNELITNACKYGLPEVGATPASASGRTGPNCDIRIEIEAEGDKVRIAVSDSGPGLPDDFDFDTAPTLGLKLIRSLSRQLRGELAVSSEGGACFELTCPRTAPS